MLNLRETQARFTAHVRNPEKNPAPQDVAPERAAVYVELCYNNVDSLLSATYPVLKSLFSETRWAALMREFYEKHPSQTPLFPCFPQEFLQFLNEEYVATPDDPPFMAELAHYEWVELAVSIDPQVIDWENIEQSTDFLNRIPAVSPYVQLLVYQYSVHEIGESHQPQTPPETPTCLVVYRDLNDKVCFLNLNAVSAHLLNCLIESPDTGNKLLSEIASALQHPQPEVVISGGLEIMQAWLERGILLGVRR
jgi:hypothetical protein